MAKSIKNIGASVRARLLALAKEKGQAFDVLLTRYVLERFLYRLSRSDFADRFVLKGAMLVTTWFDEPHRPTRDIDLLGFGDPSADPMLAVFRSICSIQVDDGVVFDLDGLRVDQIREELEYGGLRLRTTATLAGARIPVVADVGFGDATEPGLEEIDLPVLLDQPPPHLRCYPRETVVAEKFQAMVMLGLANTRLKDFYDVWMLSKAYEFDADRLAQAIAATFQRRKTEIPAETPDAFTDTFVNDAAKRRQWGAFIRNMTIEPAAFEAIVSDIAGFLMPIALRARALVPAGE